MNFGEKLKLFAKKNFGSLTTLAKNLGMSIGHLSQYVNGVNKPGLDFLLKLKELGCDINWLLSDDENPPPETDALLKKRIAELEEENERLYNSISQIHLLTQALEREKKTKGKKKKN